MYTHRLILETQTHKKKCEMKQKISHVDVKIRYYASVSCFGLCMLSTWKNFYHFYLFFSLMLFFVYLFLHSKKLPYLVEIYCAARVK